MRRLLWIGLFGLLVAACSPAAAVKPFEKGDELAYYDFNAPGSFEEATYANGDTRLQIKDGVYTITLTEGDSELWYGQWGDPQSDVVIDVETHQFTESENTTYGVMCRVRGAVGQTVADDPALDALAAEVGDIPSLNASADVKDEPTAEVTEVATEEATLEAAGDATAEATVTTDDEATAEATVESVEVATEEATANATEEATVAPEETATEEATAEATQDASATVLNVNNGDGYLFLVEGSGRFAIMRSRGRSVTPLVNWTDSAAINKGPAQNRIRAVCLGDYLALYVNDQFLGDATDDTYTQGQVGLVGASADRLGLLVQFDNLTVSAATPG
jgi:Flp pilus assembly protein TadG